MQHTADGGDAVSPGKGNAFSGVRASDLPNRAPAPGGSQAGDEPAAVLVALVDLLKNAFGPDKLAAELVRLPLRDLWLVGL